MLLQANQIIMDLTDGQMQLMIDDIYRPSEVQRIIWDEEYDLQIKTINGNAAEALRLTKILVSDPRDFPKTVPIHTTGAAVDVGIWDNIKNAAAPIIIDDNDDDIDGSVTDYFERKENLSEIEQVCLRNRRMLYFAMISAGFENYPREAWHYDYKDQMWAMVRRMKGDTNAVAEYGYAINPEKDLVMRVL
jgi:D-alanyl-D-alanine dipeptidase